MTTIIDALYLILDPAQAAWWSHHELIVMKPGVWPGLPA